MSDAAILESYIELAKFISLCFSDSVEVVVHDVSNLDRSVVAIYNGQASGRGLAAPMTDFGLKMIHQKIYERQDFVANYTAQSEDGKQTRSSTYFIKNHKGKLIGTLCINVDISRYLGAYGELEKIVHGLPTLGELRPEFSQPEPPQEILSRSLVDVVRSTASEFVAEHGVTLDRLNPNEKVLLVEKLYDKGLFMLKGGISEVAQAVGISEPTIYRCLKKVKARKSGEAVSAVGHSG